MKETTKNAIAAHALAGYPREICGLLVIEGGEEIYVPCRNTAATPTEHFVMAPQDYAAAEDRGQIVAVVHSHPGAAARPSMADKAMCETSGIPIWIIVSLGMQADHTIGIDDWCEFGPTGYIAPLLGREFSHGVLDCYSLVRDWYRLERGIVLPNFARADAWWEDGESNLYVDNYEAAGFTNLGPDVEPEPGDVLLMQIRSKNGVPNHAGVYLGDGIFIHHMYGQLSGRTVWGGLWARCLRAVLRYIGEKA
ncbi:C40 family peptidase [Caballeronia sp. DA-9]|uniref:C40 family peptidase n=1 Tax=Caballeronia sp. DA-9 TaxID=3436237 RepID=UPI003F681D45